jgi:ferredoxin-NADP reductase
LTIADPDGGLLPSWTPGAHLDVVLPSGRRRQYSLCGPPGRRTDYRIAVRRIADGGGGSIEMHEGLDVGDTLVFEGPRNAFYLGTAERDALFVIGGIGVTPILPMMQAAQARGMDWRAIYAGRSREYMPFLDEVLSVAPDRVTVWADDEHGRVATVGELLSGTGPWTAVYVCAGRPACWTRCGWPVTNMPTRPCITSGSARPR